MSYQIKNSSRKRNKTLLIVAVITLLILLSGAYYFLVIRNNKSVDPPKPDSATQELNLNPPTEAELNETEQFKQNLANNSQSSSDSDKSSDGLKPVTPVIGYLQQSENKNIESNGYISGITEAGGTCTLILEKNGVKVTESRQAMMDAQGMICGHMVISRAKLSEGEWKAHISYASSTSKGSSEERKIEVK
jgi:hypothetical protein